MIPLVIKGYSGFSSCWGCSGSSHVPIDASGIIVLIISTVRNGEWTDIASFHLARKRTSHTANRELSTANNLLKVSRETWESTHKKSAIVRVDNDGFFLYTYG